MLSLVHIHRVYGSCVICMRPVGRYTLHKLFHAGRLAWFFKTSYPSPVGDWLEHNQALAEHAKTNNVRERKLHGKKCLRWRASFKVSDGVLVHVLRLPAWPRNYLQDL